MGIVSLNLISWVSLKAKFVGNLKITLTTEVRKVKVVVLFLTCHLCHRGSHIVCRGVHQDKDSAKEDVMPLGALEAFGDTWHLWQHCVSHTEKFASHPLGLSLLL